MRKYVREKVNKSGGTEVRGSRSKGRSSPEARGITAARELLDEKSIAGALDSLSLTIKLIELKELKRKD